MYSKYRYWETELIRIARQHGYDGTPFLRDTPPLGTRQQELDAITLSLAVSPRPQRVWLRNKVRDWARNIVMSSARDHYDKAEKERQKRKPADFVVENFPEQTTARDAAGKTVSSKINRERRRASS